MAGEQDDSIPEREDLSQLELPKLFRRGRTSKDADTDTEPAPDRPVSGTAAPDPAEAVPEPDDTRAPATPATTPAAEPTTAATEPVEAEAAPPAPSRRRGRWRRRETDPAAVAAEPDTAATPGPAVAEPDTVATTPHPPVVAPDRTAPPEPTVVEPAATAQPEPTVVDQRPSAGEGAPVETSPPAHRPLEDHTDAERWEPSAGQAPATEPRAEPEPAAPAKASPTQRLGGVRLPPLAGQVAAAVIGAVVGLVGVGLVVLSERGCQAVRGASSCGPAGLFLILAVAALMVVLGALAFNAWRQDAALSTSFMGVGLLAVVVMLFLLPVVFRWFMVLVMPVLGAGTFTLSWWVSNRMGPEARKINDEYSRPIHR